MSRRRFFLVYFLFTLFFAINLDAASYGSDTAVSIVNPFAITGPDNIINTFGCATNGFAFTDAGTTCSFNSVFPVAGPITLKGGTLWLQKDLILTNVGYFSDLGRIKAQSHAVDLPESFTSFAYGTQPSGAVVLSLIARVTATRSILSADWSYDGNYIVYGITSGVGSDLYIYEFTGTSLVLRASANLANPGNSVRWRPNSYQLAVAANAQIRTYSFTPPATLTLIDTETPGGTYFAVSWQGRGNYLAAGGSDATNTFVRIYSVNPGGTMSLVTTNTNNTTAQFNGTITNDVLKWAPVGNKNDLITGSSGGSFHLYNFDGSLLNHLKNYPQGTAITSLDWASTSTYMALGFSNGNIKTYQHTAEVDSIGVKSTFTSGSTTSAKTLSWKFDATELAVGFALSASFDEFQLLNFDTSTYVLSSLYGINLTTDANSVRYSPSGTYIARGDPTTSFLSVYKESHSVFVFEDVKLYLTGNITLGSPLTFKGNCILNTRNNLITCTGDAAINVAANSNLIVEQTNFHSETPKIFALEGGTSNVAFRNASIELDTDFLWGDGKFDNYETLVITGPYLFDYESAYTSTIHSDSNLIFQDGAEFKIGKTTLQKPDPLVFEDNTAQLTLDNATLHVTGSGLKLTKGIINIYNQSNFIIDHPDNTQSCSLILGDSALGSNYDTSLILNGEAASLNISNGPIVLNSVSPYMNQFLGQSHILIEDNGTVAIKRPIVIDGGQISADETARFIFDPNTYMVCQITHFTNPLLNGQNEDYYLTSTLITLEAINLYSNNILSLNTGLLSQTINITGSGNLITGIGRFQGLLNFADSNSQLTWNIPSPLELLDHVSLNGGRIIFSQDSSFIDGLTFKTTGTVDLSGYNFYLAPSETTWNGNIYWMGDGGNLNFKENVTLTGVWTFSGDVIINGYNRTLELKLGGRIVLERGARLTLRDVLIDYLADNNPIVCMDDSCQIVFDSTKMALLGDYSFNKGSFLVLNNTLITSVGEFDSMYTFSYESTQTSTINEVSSLQIGPRARLSIGRENSAQTNPTRQPLIFYDATSPLILDGGTLHITSSGMILTKGILEVHGESHIEVDNSKYEYSLILGDGAAENDFEVLISGDGTLSINSGKVFYNNYQADRIVFENLASVLNLGANSVLATKRDLTLSNGVVMFAFSDALEIGQGTSLFENNITHFHDSPHAVHKLRAHELNPSLLMNGDYFYVAEGETTDSVFCAAGTSSVGGVGGLLDTITLNNHMVTMQTSMLQFFNDVILNGGTVIALSDLKFYSDKTFTGSGTVNLSGQEISLNTADTNLTSTICWIGSKQGKVKMRANNRLSGTWTFGGNTELDGSGNVLDLTSGGNLVVQSGGNLTLHSVKVIGLQLNNVRCLGENATLIIRDSELVLSSDYSFTSGKIRFEDDVIVSGTNTFVYRPTNASSGIAANSTLFLDLGTTFSYAPTSANRDLLGMDDETAALYINGCTLSSTTTGMRLTKGSLVVGNKNYLINDGATSVSQGICFGNGTSGGGLYIDILAGGSIDLKSGILDYRNLN